jgi:small subunit ribosomal protein S17
MVAEQTEKKIKRTLQGKVVSDKMNKTIVVAVTRKVKHPAYGKYITKITKFHAHDEENQCKIGDEVIIVETRPIAKTKSWTLLRIVEKAE